MDSSSQIPLKKRVAARFSKATDSYELGADVQMEIVGRVAGLVRGDIGEGELWGDLGSGSGMLIERLKSVPAGTRFVCLDLAFAPLRRVLQARRADMAVCGDIDFPPIRPGVFDGAAVASVLQWAERPDEALRGVARMLKPGGCLYFSAFVDGSFEELAHVRSRMDLPAAVWLPTVSELLKAFDSAGFSVAVDEVENFEMVQRFPDALAVLEHMSSTGVTATGGRLLSRAELDELCRNYALEFSKGGTVPLTYRAVIGKVRAGAD